MSGILGRLFREFAITITTAILISGVVSVTLTPMLASRFLRVASLHGHGRFARLMEDLFQRAFRAYEWTLAIVLRHRPVMLGVFVAVLAATVAMFEIVPKGFIPDQDNDSLNVNVQAAQGTSYYDMVQNLSKVAAVINANPYVDTFFASTGGGFGSMNMARFNVQLTPRRNRPLTAAQIAQQIRPQLLRFPGFRAFVSLPPAIQIGGRVSKSLYQFTMQSSDISTMYPAATQLVDEVRKSDLVQDVTSDLQLGNPQGTVQINRERAASLGVTAQQIELALYNAYGSRQVSTIYTPNNAYWVVMELLPKYQRDLSALDLLYVRSNSGTLVPLSAMADISQTAGPLSVNHSGQLPSVTLSFNLRPGVALGSATKMVEATAAKILPADITTGFSGTAQAFQSTQAGMLALLGIAIFVIYVVLGILYESFIHPITILSGLPFAAFGALLTLLIFKIDLSVYAFVGIILLVGLVKKNAIMMIDFALVAERSCGLTPEQSIYEACLLRYRPIMMTTMAALFGAVPLALGSGTGSELRRPLGITIIGGLLISQLLTLYTTPVIYLWFDRLARRFSGRRPAE
jgi:HAE1 family hydrophobic/amphiphilic exporter-1